MWLKVGLTVCNAWFSRSQPRNEVRYSDVCMTNTVKRFALETFHFRRQRLLQNETAVPVAQLCLSYKLFNFSRYRLITKPICLLRAAPYRRSDFIADKVSCQRTRSCPGRCSWTRGSYKQGNYFEDYAFNFEISSSTRKILYRSKNAWCFKHLVRLFIYSWN